MQFVQHKEKRCLGFIDAVTNLGGLKHGIDEIGQRADFAAGKNDINGFGGSCGTKRDTVSGPDTVGEQRFCAGFNVFK